MTQHWIIVACRDHVKKGVSDCFAQACHGKPAPLKKMAINDWVIYYSPTETFKGKTPCRRFTAAGRVSGDQPYQFKMSDDFIPWRRDVTFIEIKEVPIKPLLHQLSFIKDPQHWGLPFRSGCFKIPLSDFQLIAGCMGIELNE